MFRLDIRDRVAKILLWTAVLAGCFVALAGEAENTFAFDCLTTPNGIPRKVLIKKKEVATTNMLGEDVPLKFFRKYCVFKEGRAGYLVGEATAKRSIIGWVHPEDALLWNTAQALYFVGKTSTKTDPVRVWLSKKDIGDTSTPYYEELLDLSEITEPFPVLAKEGPLVKIAFLWDVPADLLAIKSAQVNGELMRGKEVVRSTDGKMVKGSVRHGTEILSETANMDIVLVIDVTGSMGPYMDQVRARINDIVNALDRLQMSRSGTEIRIGMVAYREYADEKSSFITKSLPLTPNSQDVSSFLQYIMPFSRGKGINAAVHDGLAAGLINDVMGWHAHSYKVMCLIGDAPPHTADDLDTLNILAANETCSSDFFRRPSEENAEKVRRLLDARKVQLFALGVGNNAVMQRSFRALITAPDRFIPLRNTNQFIQTLERQLLASRREQGKMRDMVKKALAKIDDPNVSYTRKEIQAFQVFNIDPTQMKALKQNIIQTGWLNPQEQGSRAVVCLHVRRTTLENWVERARENLDKFTLEPGRFTNDILQIYTGDVEQEIGAATSIGDVVRMADDIAYQPPILEQNLLTGIKSEDKPLIFNLRVAFNNLNILLVMDNLFDKYDEGWIPMDLMPGTRLREVIDDVVNPITRGETKKKR